MAKLFLARVETLLSAVKAPLKSITNLQSALNALATLSEDGITSSIEKDEMSKLSIAITTNSLGNVERGLFELGQRWEDMDSLAESLKDLESYLNIEKYV